MSTNDVVQQIKLFVDCLKKNNKIKGTNTIHTNTEKHTFNMTDNTCSTIDMGFKNKYLKYKTKYLNLKQ